ncbi:MAG: glutamate racemase [Bacteroidaceae bacterium]|nr:glutamate racemase [Bacteroidaceae bacterium]
MNSEVATKGSIGVFDSGYGGLTILRQIRQHLPQYDYIYLGDNARAPYGPRSFEVIYNYTLQAVEALFNRGCQLVILACNTASAKALRSIQECDLPRWGGDRRVLGVIRPTVEAVGALTRSRHVGLLATPGTVGSGSYELELRKLYGDIVLTSVACPMWVALVEYGEFDSPGADYFIQKRIETIMRTDPEVDTLILGCTHFPLLMEKIAKYTPTGVRLVPQGEYVAQSLVSYLDNHEAMRARCTTTGTCTYLTTESVETFAHTAQIFLREALQSVEKIEL